jgi:hypothetical protein
LMLARRNNGSVVLQARRPPRPNPRQDAYALARLLWRDEALTILADLNLADGVRSKPRSVLWRRLAQGLLLGVLSALVQDCLCKRISWQSAS